MRARWSSLALASTVSLVACSYDWSRGAPPSDAAGDVAADASTDAFLGDTPDALGPDLGDDTGESADTAPPGDVGDGGDGAPDCATLTAAVVAARAKAKVCVSSPTACTATVVDECNCASTVGDPAAPEAKDYADAARALRESGCKVRCGATCGATRPGFCLVDDAGTGTACAGA